MSFTVSLAEYVLGCLTSDQLPDIAAKAMEEGLDTPSLRILAGIRHDYLEADGFLKSALKELEMPCPSETEAVFILIHHNMELIVHKKIDPIYSLLKTMRIVDMHTDLLNYKIEAYEKYGSLSALYCIYALSDDIDDNNAVAEQDIDNTRKNLREEIIRLAADLLENFDFFRQQILS